MTIIVDSDGLIGMFDEEDGHFLAAQSILKTLSSSRNQLIYPATTIAESVTLLRVRLNRPDLANQVTNLLLEGGLQIESVDEQILKDASLLLGGKDISKHHTMFDAIVAVIAKKYQADAIFSFDKFYKSQGFKLASEL